MLLSITFRNIRARRTRSLLSALGIGVSIAIIISIFTLSTHLKEELGITSEITQADMVATQRGLAGPLGSSIPESYIEDLEMYDGIERTTGFLLANLSLPGISSFNLFGVRPEDSELYSTGQQITCGRHIQNPGEVVLGRIAGENLDLQMGDALELESGEEFTITGMYETGSVYLDSGGMISLQEAQEVIGREGRVTLIALYLKQGTDKDELVEQIEEENHFLEIIPSSYLLSNNPGTDLVNATSWGLSLIAVIMGCIGVAIAMSMSVSERTREIGVLKAIGWSKLRIIRMILGESMLLSLMGYVFGSLLAIVVIRIVTSLPTAKDIISPSLSVESFFVGLAVALLLASVGGVFPAYMASRLSPMEALRHE